MSAITKRSIMVEGRTTSISLEQEFWDDLKAIARERNSTLSDLVALINAKRQQTNLSSAIRVFVLEHFILRHAASASGLFHLSQSDSSISKPSL